jgi:hypothetical protein
MENQLYLVYVLILVEFLELLSQHGSLWNWIHKHVLFLMELHRYVKKQKQNNDTARVRTVIKNPLLPYIVH